ncbi:MAG: hypothetical protein AAFS10_05515, partial [Myxococcota bacterium]
MDFDTYATITAFFMPEGDPVRTLLAADQALTDVSHGPITRALPTPRERRQRGFAGRDHLLSEVVFGPTRDGSCLCGSVIDDIGTTCRQCGVECGSAASRAERFGHMEIPCGFVHPDLVETMAQWLGWDRSAVLRTPPRKIREALRQTRTIRALHDGFEPGDLILTQVPVVPPRDRPLGRIPSMDDGRWFVAHTVHAMPDPATDAYQQLLNAVPYPPDAPWFEGEAVEALNNAVAQLCSVLSQAVGSKGRRFQPPRGWDRHASGLQDTPSGDTGAQPTTTVVSPNTTTMGSDHGACICKLGNDGLAVVQRSGTLKLIDWHRGLLLDSIPVPGTLIGLHDDTALFQTEAHPVLDGDPVLQGVFLYHIHQRSWLE